MSGMAEVLLEHRVTRMGRCLCGDTLFDTSPERIANHIAAALAAAGVGPVKDAAAKALEDAADEMDAVIACGDVAEVAAPVEGSVGRPEAISNRDSLYEEPSYWLRARAAELSKP